MSATPAQSRVKIAIVGFSGLIGKRHTKHVLENQSVDLVALVDPSPVAPALKTALGVPDAVPLLVNVTELLQSITVSRPDCALVCTPHQTHAHIATELVEAGIHVFVEKPVTDEVQPGRDLVAQAKAKGVHLLVGHHRRFNPYIAATKKALDGGVVGDVLAVSGLWTAFKPDPYFNADPALAWRKFRSRGGGVVLNNFVHEADCMQHLFGRIVRVHAEEITPQRCAPDEPDRVEEGVALTLRFESGAVGTYILSDAVVSPHNFEMGTGENPHIPRVRVAGSNRDEIDVYRIFGTKGTLSVPDMTLSSYAGDRSWNEELQRQKLTIDSDPRVPLERQLDHFVRVVRGEEVPNCDGKAGLEALQVCRAILESLETSSTIDIAE
ncbi:hypothetical protein Sste5346_010260 [Sporothrix stenoceras]|uniref:Quinate utilization oxidoreductase QutH n=1 Tax=Sporothrix stenoceras TaxID=5173 RepID=A0ABR3YGB5_9PEZI